MTNDELNEYIKHYLEEDKTHSAIMLTAPWGTGKSYYIQNKLMPFIDSDEEKRCIVVSLYGLKDLHEISKSIYLEIRAKAFAKKSEKLSTGKLIGKTIIKGIASFFNVDLSMKEEDLQKMYESIDLTGKLIILEDLERSNIDIIEIMGYVNNLVEQDGVKVLLVANEEEIIKEEKQKIESESEAVKNILDGYSKQKELPKLKEDAKDYLHIKEKTISDTINFVAPLSESIKQIMASFDCEYFDTLLQEKNSDIIKEIIGKIGNQQNINLRSFIFACQKTTDILNYGTLISINFLMSEMCSDKLLGLCEQVKSKWKIALDMFSSFYKCYIKGFPHEESFKLLEEHERVQINRNLGHTFSTDQAYSYYKTLYPNGVNQNKFEKGFLTNSGYTIDAKGKTKNLTAIVKEFIKKFANPNVIGSFDRSMLLDYVESQMLSHANGYMWYANRGAWGEVHNIIIGMDMCLMFILESILAMFKMHKSIEETDYYKQIINIVRNSLKRIKPICDEKAKLLQIPGIAI